MLDRLATHAALSERLSRLDDAGVVSLLDSAGSKKAGVVGYSQMLTLLDTPVFVKRIPLTDLERRPENRQSTRNLFDVPFRCHYGLGGPEFSAWRELASNQIATRWVLSGECADFPITYHWRVLPRTPEDGPPVDPGFWANSAAVRGRAEAIRDASAHLVLFCEHVPENLLAWLGTKLAAGADAAAEALALVDAHLAPGLAFMNARGLTHFDPHFENILTDGRRLYFGDFGLALSSAFELTADERRFLDRHRRYDYGRAAVAYAHCISATLFPHANWHDGLRAFLATGTPALPPAVATVIRREAPLALSFLEFSRRLQTEDAEAPYPAEL